MWPVDRRTIFSGTSEFFSKKNEKTGLGSSPSPIWCVILLSGFFVGLAFVVIPDLESVLRVLLRELMSEDAVHRSSGHSP